MKNMHTDKCLRNIIRHGLIDEFISELGVRQGDTLSPNHFKFLLIIKWICLGTIVMLFQWGFKIQLLDIC